jgi:hypothetical protein
LLTVCALSALIYLAKAAWLILLWEAEVIFMAIRRPGIGILSPIKTRFPLTSVS